MNFNNIKNQRLPCKYSAHLNMTLYRLSGAPCMHDQMTLTELDWPKNFNEHLHAYVYENQMLINT